MPKMLSSEFQTCSIKIEDFKYIAINSFNPISIKRATKLLGISYFIPNMFSSKFQSYSIEIEDFKIYPINPFNPNSTKEGSANFKLNSKNLL